MGPVEQSQVEAARARRAKFFPNAVGAFAKTSGPATVTFGTPKVQPFTPAKIVFFWHGRPIRAGSYSKLAWVCSMALGKPEVEEEPPISVRKILSAVAKDYDVQVVQLKGVRRTAELVEPRHVAMYLAKRLTGLSFPAIGRAFGGKDHTTIMHAAERIRVFVEVDSALADRVRKLEAALVGRVVMLEARVSAQ